MSSSDENSACQVCYEFEPQAWRKSLCRNCFHSLDEHSEDLLAAEAEAVARENAEKQTVPEKTGPGKADSDKGKTTAASAASGKGKTADVGEKDVKVSNDVKSKFGPGAGKDSGKAAPWAKDLGREYSKTGKTPQTGSKSAGTPASSSSPSSSSSSTSSSKSSAKSTTSSSSSSSTTTTPSSKAAAAPSSPADTSPKSATLSKAKSFASKFESKASSSSSDKPTPSKPSDLKSSGSSGKLANDTSKPASKPEDSKSTDSKTLDSPKGQGSKDSKSKISDSVSKFSSKSQGAEQGKGKEDVSDKKDSLKSPTDNKDKKSLASKFGEKENTSRSKAAPFGKDMLKNTKDTTKKDNKANDIGLEKTKLKDSPKETAKLGSPKTPTPNDKDKSLLKGDKQKEDSNSKKSKEEPVSKVSSNNKSGDIDANVSQRSQHAASTSPDTKSAQQSPGSYTSVSDSSPPGPRVGQGATTRTGKLADSGSASVGEGSGKDTRAAAAATQGNANDVTRKYLNDSKGDESGIVGKKSGGGSGGPSFDSSKTSDKDKPSLYKDRGKDKGGGGGGGGVESGVSARVSATDPPSRGSPAAGREDARSAGSPATPSSPVPATNASSPSTPTSPLSPKTATPSSPLASSVSTSSSSPLSTPTSKPGDKKPKDLRLNTDKASSVLGKFKELEKKSGVQDGDSKPPGTKSNVPGDTVGAASASPGVHDEKLKKTLEEKEEKLRALEQQVSKMEGDMKKLEEEKERLRKEESSSRQTQKEDMEKLLQELRGQLDSMGQQCERLQGDNQTLLNKVHVQEESVRRDQVTRGKNVENVHLEEDLELAEKELEEVKEVNKDLQSQIMEMKNEMDEMYDHFRENEHDEFRELQKELDMTAKNCRILQFKLRKSERRNEQIEEDRIHYEEKLRMLQDQFDSQDAKNHIRVLEEELRVAKEVSVRLHDELDIVEDKRGKALEENRHLTELLEHTDKRQFRLEMEIDKLRDIVSDLKMQLKEAKGSNNNKESSPDRKVPSYIYSRSIMD